MLISEAIYLSDRLGREVSAEEVMQASAKHCNFPLMLYGSLQNPALGGVSRRSAGEHFVRVLSALCQIGGQIRFFHLEWYTAAMCSFKSVSYCLATEEERIMSIFSPSEIQYLQSQRLGRLATVGSNGQPHVVPVAFRYNPDLDTIDIGGHDFASRKKFRDVQANPNVAIVVDDIASLNPWKVRGIEIRGQVEVLPTGGTELLPWFCAP